MFVLTSHSFLLSNLPNKFDLLTGSQFEHESCPSSVYDVRYFLGERNDVGRVQHYGVLHLVADEAPHEERDVACALQCESAPKTRQSSPLRLFTTIVSLQIDSEIAVDAFSALHFKKIRRLVFVRRGPKPSTCRLVPV